MTGVRHDDARMVSSRTIQLHAVKLNHVRNGSAGQLKLRVGEFQIDLTVVRPTVIRSNRPGEAIVMCHQGVHRDRIYAIPADRKSG